MAKNGKNKSRPERVKLTSTQSTCRDAEKISSELVIVRSDYILVRLLVVLGITACLLIFIIQYNTSMRSYEMLQQLTEQRFPHFLPEEPDFDIWDWDPHNLMLTVNTSFYIH